MKGGYNSLDLQSVVVLPDRSMGTWRRFVYAIYDNVELVIHFWSFSGCLVRLNSPCSWEGRLCEVKSDGWLSDCRASRIYTVSGRVTLSMGDIIL